MSLGFPSHPGFLFPTFISTNYNPGQVVLLAELDDILGDMMEIVLQAPVSFLASLFVWFLVEPLINGFHYSTIDQHWFDSCLVGSYRTEVVDSKVNETTFLICQLLWRLALWLWNIYFINNIYNKALGFWCDYYLFERLV